MLQLLRSLACPVSAAERPVRLRGMLAPVSYRLAVLAGLVWAGALPAAAQQSPAQQSPAQQPPAPEAPAAIEKADVLDLLDQLDANQLQTRQQAERRLRDLGPSILAWLPTTTEAYSAEARLRLQRVRVALEKARAQQRVEGSLIKFTGIASLEEALEAITFATGSQFEVAGDRSQPLSIADSSSLSFWQALDTVLDAAQMDINFYGGERGVLALVPRREGRRPRTDSGAYAGVYRLEPTTVTARRALNTPELSGMQVAMEIAWEPRLTPIGLTLPLGSLQAKLDDGQVLTSSNPDGELNVATNADVAFSEVYLPFRLPAGRPRQIESISGVVRALLPGPTEAFAFPLEAGAQERTTGSVTVRVDEIRDNGTLTEIRLLLTLEDAENALESHRQWIFENAAFVLGGEADRREHLGYEVYRQTANSVGIGYLFDLGETPEAFTFHYQTPTGVVPNEVTFVMQDIPLP